MVLSSAKLQMFVLSIKRKESSINGLNNNGLKIDPCVTLLTISYHEEFIFVRCLRFDSYVLDLNQSYQCHSLQTLQQEGHVASNHKF